MANKSDFASQKQDVPIVFIHGWGLNAGVWQPLAETLADKFRIITVDLPGYGENHQQLCSPYSLTNIAEKICQTINEPAVYVGWSLGGLVANQIALEYPSLVTGLVNVASTPCFLQQDNWRGIQPTVLTNFHRQLAQDTQKTIDSFLKIQAMGSPHIRQDIKRIRTLIMQYPMANKNTLMHSLTLLETTDQRNKLINIKCPYLRMYGKLDGLVPKEVIANIARLAPTSEQVIFEQSSHAPFISELSSFTDQLQTWLEKVTN
ncbi:pimeloyl-ACP methyl ester esterase BioH [Thalassotalea sp. PP2-459]|uniref:pimeloyl-ACP methyl ester esterase BioH n=1 Tax=Thalassotalea sp. PP2-459 TaxID=1742724 RepID=UPI000944CE6F|nr:pimeloyl-ACP methyl ester esterase BioH [Thalassotalea sp. PP2-459]OKY26671.1 pimeloyl-[acyl-carrier protein] methyl ester esterase [Thalassotalea sp. PP2-459]